MKRGRNQRRRQGVNPNRAYDSNGPEVRIRGTANQIFDKYQALARDAASAGDRVKAENYLQHAEHYFRLIRAMQPNPSPNSSDANDFADGDQPGVARNARDERGGDRGNGRPRHDRNDDRDDARDDEEDDQAASDGNESAGSNADNGVGEVGGGEEASDRPTRKRRSRRTRPQKGDVSAEADASAEEVVVN
ncbi:MAG: DUF4167 domain-containing protein [Alphaproteobacteria bacterium]|nr:DUF4167 domain-containing protein [Alphaproteobacteria bacterium]